MWGNKDRLQFVLQRRALLLSLSAWHRFRVLFFDKYKCVRNFSPSLGDHFNMSGSKSEEIGSLIYFCNDFKNLVTVQHPRKSTIVVLISC